MGGKSVVLIVNPFRKVAHGTLLFPHAAQPAELENNPRAERVAPSAEFISSLSNRLQSAEYFFPAALNRPATITFWTELGVEISSETC